MGAAVSILWLAGFNFRPIEVERSGSSQRGVQWRHEASACGRGGCGLDGSARLGAARRRARRVLRRPWRLFRLARWRLLRVPLGIGRLQSRGLWRVPRVRSRTIHWRRPSPIRSPWDYQIWRNHAGQVRRPAALRLPPNAIPRASTQFVRASERRAASALFRFGAWPHALRRAPRPRRRGPSPA